MAALFEPFTLKDMTLRNRIVMPPMCMYSAVDGMADDWHLQHYASRAVGGAGLVVVEATGVVPEGRISAGDLGLWRDEQIPGLRRVVDAIHLAGSKAAVQLGHAGRKAEVEGFSSVSSTDVPFNDEYAQPERLTREGIKQVVMAFGQAARRAREAGFDLVEIHGAHGYLINQFLSPLVNDRADEYGKDAEGRVRILGEIIQAIRAEWPMEKPLAVRVSGEEYATGGQHPLDVATLLNRVKADGLDMVHVSSGGVVDIAVRSWPGYQIPYAETIRRETGLPVIGGGGISSPQLAEEIIGNGRADLVFLGRELLRNPYWALHAARDLRADIPWPEQYERAKQG